MQAIQYILDCMTSGTVVLSREQQRQHHCYKASNNTVQAFKTKCHREQKIKELWWKTANSPKKCLHCSEESRLKPGSLGFVVGDADHWATGAWHSPHLVHGSLGLHESTRQTRTWSSQLSSHSSCFMLLILYYGPGIFVTPKLPVPFGGTGLQSNTWLCQPIQLHSSNSISIGSDVSVGLINVSDIQTDRPRRKRCSHSPHSMLCITMRPGQHSIYIPTKGVQLTWS